MASGSPKAPVNNAVDAPVAPVASTAVSRPPGRPRDQSLASRRREEIIVAASKIFAQNGYRATDLNLVAERLGVAKGTIYNYFPSKAELFLACVELGKAGLHQAHQQAVMLSDCPVTQIRQAMRAYFEFFDQNPHHIELMMQARGEFKDNSLLASSLARPEGCEGFAPLMELLDRGVKQGVIRPLTIKGMHDALLNLVVGAIFSKHFGQGSQSLTDQTAEILEIVFKGIILEEPAKNGS